MKYARSRTFKVTSCVTRRLRLSPDSDFLDLSDTGASFCNRSDCVIELLDAFGNVVPDEVQVAATLEVSSDQEIAGIAVSSSCKCTGLNSGPGGAVGTTDHLVGDYTLFLSADGTSDRCECSFGE